MGCIVIIGSVILIVSGSPIMQGAGVIGLFLGLLSDN